MSRYRKLWRIIIVFCLLSMNLIPFLNYPSLSEFGAPDGSGHTTVSWYIDGTDDVAYNNKEYWTKDIQINSSGKMTWDNIYAYIHGNVTVQSMAMFNLTDCYLNLSGDFIISGIVNFDNVTLVMNSSFDGEFEINISTTGSFNVLNNSNITAFDTITPIDIYANETGYESWGLHYNFSVYGNLTIDNSYISYTYGSPTYFGGIYFHETSDGLITNSEIYRSEFCGIFVEGDTEHVFQNNHIYNATRFGIYLYDHANATVDNNTIETGLDNLGTGIVCDDHCAPVIIRNTIRNNHLDGIFLINYSNASIRYNLIENNQRVGIIFLSEVTGISGFFAIATTCYPRIFNNTIINNKEFGIYDYCCPAQIQNNTVSHTQNQSGIFVISYQPYGTYTVHFTCFGNITNNTIQYNNHYGISIVSIFRKPYVVTMDIKNNTITNNNWSGLYSLGGMEGGTTQRSPFPHVGFNTFSYNNHYGIENRFALNYRIWENELEYNNLSGLACMNSSKPEIHDNNLTWNFEHGIYVEGSTPHIYDNYIRYNNHSGVYGDGGNNNFRIRLNDINYNFRSGIECNTSSCSIQNNNITNNSQDGIKLTAGAPVINQDNIINYNGWNGLACYQNARPSITDVVFQFNGKNGIYSDASDPSTTTTGAVDDVLISDNTDHGISCANGATGRITATIVANSKAGVYTTGAGTITEILGSNISANGGDGVNATSNSAPEITNSTIGSDNIGCAFYIEGGADPVALDTAFNDSDVYFKDTASTLTVKWFVNILTISDQTSNLVPNCNVTLDSTTQSGINPVYNGFSNAFGEINWLRITEYIDSDVNGDHQITGAERVYYTPTDVYGEAYNFRDTHVTPTPVIDQTQTITIRLLPNRQPGQVSNIQPLKTHNLYPTITWDTSTDPDPGQVLQYKVWIGSTQNTSNILESSLLSTNSYTVATDELNYGEFGNKSYHITIVSDDLHGGQNYVFHTLYVVNNKPSRPEINLTFSEPLNELLKTVSCEITVPSVDPDGDEVNYTYKWFKNGQEITSLRVTNTKNIIESISAITDDITFEKGDEWEVRVNANDGLGEPHGRGPYQSAMFSIGNLGPKVALELEDIVMEEDSKLLNTIDLTEIFNDIDQDKLDYEITVSDDNLSVTEDPDTHYVDIIPKPNWNGEAMINFTCFDEEKRFATQHVKVTVTPVNDIPEFKQIGKHPWRSGITFLFSDDDGAIEDKLFTILIQASDYDIEQGEADEVSFKASSDAVEVNQWDSNPLNATLIFTPTNDDVGTFSVTIYIKDLDTSYIHPTNIEIQVANVNDEPSLVSVMRYSGAEEYFIPNNKELDLQGKITAKEGQRLTLKIIASDPDLDNNDDDLTFYSNNIGIITMDSDTGEANTAKMEIKPEQINVGLLEINITVKDQQGEQDSATILLKVENVNDAPHVRIIQPAISNKIYYEDETIDFEAEATDSDIPYGDDLIYTWSSSKSGDLGNELSISINLTVGQHVITFSAEDSEGEVQTNSTIVIIREREPEPPSEPKDDEDDSSSILMMAAIALGVVLLILFLIIFIVIWSRHKKKIKKASEPDQKPIILKGPPYVPETPRAEGVPGVTTTTTPQGITTTPTGVPGPAPTQPQIPATATGTPTPAVSPGPAAAGAGLPTATQPALPPGQTAQTPTTTTTPAQIPYIPAQMMTCPRCNTIMTFSPDGSTFCINCGYTPSQGKK